MFFSFSQVLDIWNEKVFVSKQSNNLNLVSVQVFFHSFEWSPNRILIKDLTDALIFSIQQFWNSENISTLQIRLFQLKTTEKPYIY